MSDILEPTEKISKDAVIDEAERYSNQNGAIAFAKGVRWAIKLVMPYIQDYWRGKFKRLIE